MLKDRLMPLLLIINPEMSDEFLSSIFNSLLNLDYI